MHFIAAKDVALRVFVPGRVTIFVCFTTYYFCKNSKKQFLLIWWFTFAVGEGSFVVPHILLGTKMFFSCFLEDVSECLWMHAEDTKYRADNSKNHTEYTLQSITQF